MILETQLGNPICERQHQLIQLWFPRARYPMPPQGATPSSKRHRERCQRVQKSEILDMFLCSILPMTVFDLTATGGSTPATELPPRKPSSPFRPSHRDHLASDQRSRSREVTE
jgi:hypothetical protein